MNPIPSLPMVGRREFLRQGGAFAGALLLASAVPAAVASGRRLKVAAVVTTFFYRSHAHVILENFVRPYLFNGQWITPDVDVVSLYVDQFPEADLARPFAQRYGIPIYPTIAAALCGGGDQLAVDAVLAIGEHGNYPLSAEGQTEYPRKRFFDEIVAVFRHSGRVVPVYNDKQLSYRWDWAKEMVDTARAMNIPLMSASSVPLAERRPPLELPPGAPIVEAVSIHGGGVESYDFHGLEVLQAMVESRKGGETGVARVQFLEGEALWRAADAGLWSPALARAALDVAPLPGQRPSAEIVRRPPPEATVKPLLTHGILVTYRDGLRAIVLAITGGNKWDFACRITGESAPRATSFYGGPWENRNLFRALSHAIQAHFRDGRAPFPVERTLLTSGIVAAEMDSRFQGGRALDTPQLAVAYTPRDYRSMREMGATWKILTEAVPQPPGLETWPKS